MKVYYIVTNRKGTPLTNPLTGHMVKDVPLQVTVAELLNYVKDSRRSSHEGRGLKWKYKKQVSPKKGRPVFYIYEYRTNVWYNTNDY